VDGRFLDSKRKRIAYLLDNVPVDPSGSLEMQSHWARYTCVIISGYIEETVKELCRSYAEDRCTPETLNYITAQLRFFQSANTEEISDLLMRFSKTWQSQFEAYVTDERKQAINSVIGNRHRVAHGLDCSVTVRQLKEWYPRINDVIDFICALLET
jgi:hypothetical protein